MKKKQIVGCLAVAVLLIVCGIGVLISRNKSNATASTPALVDADEVDEYMLSTSLFEYGRPLKDYSFKKDYPIEDSIHHVLLYDDGDTLQYDFVPDEVSTIKQLLGEQEYVHSWLLTYGLTMVTAPVKDMLRKGYISFLVVSSARGGYQVDKNIKTQEITVQFIPTTDAVYEKSNAINRQLAEEFGLEWEDHP